MNQFMDIMMLKHIFYKVIGQWIKKSMSQGNVLALQGPMGNGKTTLVKEDIAKAIGRPFFIYSIRRSIRFVII